MTEEEKLHQAYYQGDRFWTANREIKELHKITSMSKKRHQIMVSQTSTLASPYTTSKGNKSSLLRCDKTY